MKTSTPDLCDAHPEELQVLEPLFRNYGGRRAFGGEVVTIKCHEDNSLVNQQVALAGENRVLVVDGGGSLRRALLGDMLAARALQNGWQGLVIYGCIRDVEIIRTLDIGVQAINTIPVKTEKHGIGNLNVPLRFAGVSIRPGDHIYADDNGIVVTDRPLP